MAFKFLQVGKANAEIDRLNVELVKVSKERDEAVAAVGENTSEVATQAEQIQADLATAKQTISTITGERDTAAAALVVANAKVAKLEADLAAKDGEVKIKVAQQALTVQAALGQPAAPVIPDASKQGASKEGIDPIRAAARKDLEAGGFYQRR
jgi:hypothetical protein